MNEPDNLCEIALELNSAHLENKFESYVNGSEDDDILSPKKAQSLSPIQSNNQKKRITGNITCPCQHTDGNQHPGAAQTHLTTTKDSSATINSLNENESNQNNHTITSEINLFESNAEENKIKETCDFIGKKLEREKENKNILSEQNHNEENTKADNNSVKAFANTKIPKVPKKPIFQIEESTKIKSEDIRKTAYHAPMIYLKKFLKYIFQLNLSFNCEMVLGTTINEMKYPLNAMIFEIFSYDNEDNVKKIRKKLYSITDEDEKTVFEFFMTRTYEEIYNIYLEVYHGPPIPNKGNIIIIFYTMKDKIEEIKAALKKAKKSERYIANYLEIFEEISKTMIDDIKKTKKTNKKERKKVFVTPEGLKKLKKCRNLFKWVSNDEIKGMKLEEE